jgi:DNA-3-methyladenine glycosylase
VANFDILPRKFFARDADAVARALLGQLLVREFRGQTQIARIVETEAYMGAHDLACHSSKGRTKRTEIMFGPPGHAYVYFIYGMYEMFNVVVAPRLNPQAVLIRAVEPLDAVKKKTHGPGLLARALHIDRRLNGWDLCAGKKLFIAKGHRVAHVRTTARIGVSYAGEWRDRPLRFFERNNTFVSSGGSRSVPARKRVVQ